MKSHGVGFDQPTNIVEVLALPHICEQLCNFSSRASAQPKSCFLWSSLGVLVFHYAWGKDLEISDSELTNRTFSLAMDIAMYLGQVFLKNHPSLKWDQPFGGKRNIDYGQPVLAGFWDGKVPFNPVGGVVTFAYGLKRQSRTGEGLREIYERWSNNITPQS